MQLTFAPLEGITTHSYRTLHHQMFGGAAEYYTPFLTPTEAGLSGKALREVLPQNNPGVPLVPQILTNHADAFCRAADCLRELGYARVNLNLGCPSGTVVAKGRGAGALRELGSLQTLLEGIFSGLPVGCEVSIKTRLGMADPGEFEDILQIYNQYPLAELIIHPRVRADFYKGRPNLQAFAAALAASRAPVCYNGDIFTQQDFAAFRQQFPAVQRVMLGRGLVANPALARRLLGGEELRLAELRAFHAELYTQCKSIQSGEKNVLCRMKEQWNYWGGLFAAPEKPLKALRKAQHLPQYESAVESIFCGCEFLPQAGFRPL